MRLYFKTSLDEPFLKVTAGFGRSLFEKLNPPWARADIERFDGCKKGDEVHLNLHLMGTSQKWVSLMTDDFIGQEEWFFVDEGKILPWPIKQWRHKHSVIKISETQSEIIDDIYYSAGPFSALIYPALWATFMIRPERYRQFFKGLT
jgi:ligand-binding SRPBCC domain-containing protein